MTPGSPLAEVLAESRSLGFLGPGPLEPQILHAAGFAELLSNGGAAAPRASGSAPRSTPGSALRSTPGSAPGSAPRSTPGSAFGALTVVDLGSGGGVPGLVVADRLSEVHMILVESSAKRAAFLRQAVGRCGWGDRVQVLEERAEVAGRRQELRHSADAVIARSFGPPAVVAECGAPFLRVGGTLVVSEPPREPAEAGDGIGSASHEGGSSPVGLSLQAGPSTRWPAEQLAALGLVVVGEARGAFGYQVLRQATECPDRYPRRVGVPAKRPLF